MKSGLLQLLIAVVFLVLVFQVLERPLSFLRLWVSEERRKEGGGEIATSASSACMDCVQARIEEDSRRGRVLAKVRSLPTGVSTLFPS